MRTALVSAVMLLLMTLTVHGQFTDWSAPVKVDGLVNTTAAETCVAVSKSGLTMYFARLTPSAGYDLLVAQRSSVTEPWGMPVLVPKINSAANEFCPALSLDEHRLYFASARPGGCGDGFPDIYVSRRHDRQDDFGWEVPQNLGCEVNSPRGDQAPTFFEDETGTVIMYFASNRVATQGFDIYQSRSRADDTFGPPSPVAELNLPVFNEIGTAVRRDGLEIVLDSNRVPNNGRDLWTATRSSTAEAWSALIPLTSLNSPSSDGGRLCMSFDGRALYFTSDRDGNFDIYVTTREKLNGKGK